MTNIRLKTIFFSIGVLMSITIQAQVKKNLDFESLKNWYNMDLTNDSIVGISTEKTYSFLKDKKGSKIIIGLIDSSIDLNHEDLKDIIWTNLAEIKNNGVDDDNNGYIDDINGWNFVEDLTFQNFEYERIIMNPSLADNKNVLNNAKKTYKSKLKDAKKNIKSTKKSLEKLKASHKIFTSYFGKSNYTFDEVLSIKTDDNELTSEIQTVQNYILSIEAISKLDSKYEPVKTNLPNIIVNRINSLRNNYRIDSILITGKTIKKDFRASLGDDLKTLNDVNYGNNNLQINLENEEHSTHIAGIIAAKRNNKRGIDGISDNTYIMPIRLSGSGDEHDKDVALSIRYAVDNGAKIINASFGKEFSPHKKFVYESILYAEENDVLIIIAAGNNNLNLDTNFSYPNDSKDLKTEFAQNVIVVGASNPYYGKNLASIFSNYGKINVDIFAPGYSIYSTIPNNKYDFKDGTSMAAPMVSGVASLIRSYYPNLTANQVKDIILKSGTKINFKVNAPGSFNKKINFSDLCSSSSILNAYNAIIMADEINSEE